jgi:hypothetical protein
MIIDINILEVASDLAHEIVCARFLDDDNLIHVEDSEGICYTEEAQDLFNELYDYYYTFLITRKEN